MIKYNKVFKYYETWSKYTYQQGLDYIYELSPTEKVLIEKEMEALQINEKIMDGNSVQNLKKHEGKTNIVFSEAFRECYSAGYLTPAMYFVKLHQQCEDLQMPFEKKILELGRGLRAFASFIRELDLAAKLQKSADEQGLKMDIMYNDDSEKDMKEHADIIVVYGDKKINMWSYMDTERGVYHTYQRLMGYRGRLSSGYHFLFPYDLRNEKSVVCNWYLHSQDQVDEAIKIIAQKKAVNYVDLINKRDQNIIKTFQFFKV